MKSLGWLHALCALGALGITIAACSSEVDTTATSAASGSTGATTGAGGSGGAGGAGSSSSTGEVFLTCPEAVASFTGDDCDFLNQDCPPGHACYPFTFNGKTSLKCEKWNGVKGVGVACTSHSECKPGLFCGLFCAPPCCPTDNAPCEGSCNFTANFDSGQTANICNYAPKCDLFKEDTCKAGSECHFDLKQKVPICAPPTGANEDPTEGKPCKYLNDCGNMQLCSNNICRYNCDLEKQAELPEFGGCPANRTCAVFDPAIPTYKTLGVCVP